MRICEIEKNSEFFKSTLSFQFDGYFALYKLETCCARSVAAQLIPSQSASAKDLLQGVLSSLYRIAAWLSNNELDLDNILDSMSSNAFELLSQLKWLGEIMKLNPNHLKNLQNLGNETMDILSQVMTWLNEDDLDVDTLFHKLNPKVRTLLMQLDWLSKSSERNSIYLAALQLSVQDVLGPVWKFFNWLNRNPSDLRDALQELSPKMMSLFSQLNWASKTLNMNPAYLKALQQSVENILNFLSKFVAWLTTKGVSDLSKIPDKPKIRPLLLQLTWLSEMLKLNPAHSEALKSVIDDVRAMLSQVISWLNDTDSDLYSIFHNLQPKISAMMTQLKWLSGTVHSSPSHLEVLQNLVQDVLASLALVTIWTRDVNNVDLDKIIEKLTPAIMSMLSQLKWLSENVEVDTERVRDIRLLVQEVLGSLSDLMPLISSNSSHLVSIVDELGPAVTYLFDHLKRIAGKYKLSSAHLNALQNLMKDLLKSLSQILDWLNNNYSDLDYIFDQLSPNITYLLLELKWLAETVPLNPDHLISIEKLVQDSLGWLTQFMLLLSFNDPNVCNILRQLRFSCDN